MSIAAGGSAMTVTMLRARRAEIDEVLTRYGAVNPRVFGSVARGQATSLSDVDLYVDLEPASGNPLLAVSGLGEELSERLGVCVDVVTGSLLRTGVSAAALEDAVALC